MDLILILPSPETVYSSSINYVNYPQWKHQGEHEKMGKEDIT
jgi:hypothetical protein